MSAPEQPILGRDDGCADLEAGTFLSGLLHLVQTVATRGDVLVFQPRIIFRGREVHEEQVDEIDSRRQILNERRVLFETVPVTDDLL
ncbi:hypothetical protein Bpla01_48760 [Burkholderia plantarii]|nr:hypothetical protein Bpla01_48760 [Burkholderia plantarii]